MCGAKELTINEAMEIEALDLKAIDRTNYSKEEEKLEKKPNLGQKWESVLVIFEYLISMQALKDFELLMLRSEKARNKLEEAM